VKYIFIFLAAVAVAPSVSASAPASLCAAEEQIVFSCQTRKKKIISLCASPLLDGASGYMQYRFGAANETPELVYPGEQSHPAASFVSGALPFSGGGAAYVTFANGDRAYSVFTGIGKGWEKKGVTVRKIGQPQKVYIPCLGPWTSQLGPEFFQKTGIPEDPHKDKFQIP
jgi:hypothetical protein